MRQDYEKTILAGEGFKPVFQDLLLECERAMVGINASVLELGRKLGKIDGVLPDPKVTKEEADAVGVVAALRNHNLRLDRVAVMVAELDSRLRDLVGD